MIKTKTSVKMFYSIFFLSIFLFSLVELQINSNLFSINELENSDELIIENKSQNMIEENNKKVTETTSLTAPLPIEVKGEVKDNGDGTLDFSISIRGDQPIDTFIIYTADPVQENYQFPNLSPDWIPTIGNETVTRSDGIDIEMTTLKLTSVSPVVITTGVTFEFTYIPITDVTPFDTSVGPAPWFAGIHQPSPPAQELPKLPDYDIFGSSWQYLNNSDTLDSSSDWNGLMLPSIIPGPYFVYPEFNLTADIFNPSAFSVINTPLPAAIISPPTNRSTGNQTAWNPTNITQHDTSANNTACSPTSAGYVVQRMFGDKLNSTFGGNVTDIIENMTKFMLTNASIGTYPANSTAGLTNFTNFYNLSVNITTYSPNGYNSTHPGSGWAQSPNITMNIIIDEFITQDEMIIFDVHGTGWGHTMVLTGLNSVADNPPANNRYTSQILDPHTGQLHNTWLGTDTNGKVYLWYGGAWYPVTRVTKISPVPEGTDSSSTTSGSVSSGSSSSEPATTNSVNPVNTSGLTLFFITLAISSLVYIRKIRK
ncbi:MAG: hypothetical protein ACW99Q_26480 [Candidatus Kariarchaeaceae archaeon]|jgi:hypothetical protein